MRQRRKGLVAVGVLALLTTTLMALPSTGAAAATCDDAYVHIDGDTITVSPTGTDDTINLQCALDVAASLPWARVVLEADDYYTSFLEVEGFHGVLAGAGMAETRLMTLPEGLDCVERSQQRRFVVLLAFGGGDVEVRDLTIKVGGRTSCAAPWVSLVNEDGSGWVAWDLDLALQLAPGIASLGSCPAAGNQDVRIDGVRIKGIFPDYRNDFIVFRGFFGGLYAGGDVLRGCPESRSTGEVLITNSAFHRMPQPVGLAWMDDSTVRFGAPGAGNRIKQAAQGLILQDMSNTHVIAEANTINGAVFFGLIAFARPDLVGDHPFTVEIVDNSVSGRFWAQGIGVIDNARETTGRTMINAVITGNTVNLRKTNYNAILASRAGGGEIVDNTITGASRVGVAVHADRWLVSGTDLSGFEPFLSDIWLTAASGDNEVHCLDPGDTVLDEGLDNDIHGCSTLELPAAMGESMEGGVPPTSSVLVDGTKAEFSGAMHR